MQTAPVASNVLRLAETRVLTIGRWPPAGIDDGPVITAGLEIERCPSNLYRMQERLAGQERMWLLVADVADEERAAEVVMCGRATRPDVNLAVLGEPVDRQLCGRWLRRGCHVYLTAESGVRRVAAALAVATDLGVQVVDEVFRSGPGRQSHSQSQLSLTPRQREVLGLLSRGLSNIEIGTVLNLSENTIEFHVRHLLSKFQARNRMQVARRAAEVGLC
jgi:DNA-binding NarL/FixJ family response regulator